MNEHFIHNVKKYITSPHFGEMRVYDEVSSTMEVAKRYSSDEKYHKNIFIALSQTDGTGTDGRRFSSQKGGVYMSVLLINGDMDERELTVRLAVAMRDAVNEISGIDGKIKWVNDIYHEDKKLCGILANSAYMGMKKAYTIIGVGLNVNQDDILGVVNAASIKMITGEEYSLEKAVGIMVNNMGKYLYEMPFDKVLDRYRHFCTSVGKKIKFIFNGNEQVGTVMNINNNGGLVVFFNGKTVDIYSRSDVVEFMEE